MQEWNNRCFRPNNNVKVVHIVGYSDKTTLSVGRQVFHPMLMTLGLPGKTSRRQFAHQRLALLPVITMTDLGLDKRDPQCTDSSIPLAHTAERAWCWAEGDIQVALHVMVYVLGNLHSCGFVTTLLRLLQGPRLADKQLQGSFPGGSKGPEGSLLPVCTHCIRWLCSCLSILLWARACIPAKVNEYG